MAMASDLNLPGFIGRGRIENIGRGIWTAPVHLSIYPMPTLIDGWVSVTTPQASRECDL